MNDLILNLENCKACIFTDNDNKPITPIFKQLNPKIIFVGENPSWELNIREPFDILSNSGKALQKNYILPMIQELNINENEIYITNLFKCKYPKSIYKRKNQEQNLINRNIEICAEKWLRQEILKLTPKIIITLGNKEVYNKFRKIFKIEKLTPSDFNKAAYNFFRIRIDSFECYILPVIHPDISYSNNFKKEASDKWSQIHEQKFIKLIGTLLN